jgi:predicted CopG family antitoxin
MKAASIAELKKKMNDLPPKVLKELCLRLIKYKKENKELLTYLLFSADDEEGYIKEIKEEMDEAFTEINSANLYWAKKSIRKILRLAAKYIKYSGNKQTEVEVLLYFCRKMKDSGIKFRSSTTLLNLYDRQIIKIKKALATLHEDLQYDYAAELEAVSQGS